MKKVLITGLVALVLLAVALEEAGNQENFIFHTPAYQGKKDLKNASKEVQKSFLDSWDSFVNRYTVYASSYNLSGGLDYTPPGDYYVNPKTTKVDMKNGPQVPVRWESFPGRIMHYMENEFFNKYGSEGLDHMFELADIGPVAYQAKYQDSIVYIPKSPCDPNPKELKMLDPIGPRGWLDEYCEMSIKRNPKDKITKLHFTCENPEYYWTLWNTDPQLVLNIYREVINPNVQLEDLCLKDKKGKPIIVRETNRHAYNPINKWNNGTVMTDQGGGAMHLTSIPNELNAEIVLAGGAAVLRSDDPDYDESVANSLICCSDYGRRFRHSDPHIGQNVYQVVDALNLKVTLLDPVGLYLQEPNYNYFTLPDNAPKGAKIEDCFKFVRGEVKNPHYPNNMILHTIMEIPESWPKSITLSDIKVLGEPIQYGSQVMQSIQVQLAATGVASDTEPKRELCATENEVPALEYLVDENILMASWNAGLIDSANVTCNILKIEAGKTTEDIAIVVDNIDAKDVSDIEISFPKSGIKIASMRYMGPLTSLPKNKEVIGYRYNLSLSVPENAKTGEFDVLIRNTKNDLGIPVPLMIEIVPNNSLGTHVALAKLQ
jgi:hypothetical protein